MLCVFCPSSVTIVGTLSRGPTRGITVAGAPGVGLGEFGLIDFALGSDEAWTAKLKDPKDGRLPSAPPRERRSRYAA